MPPLEATCSLDLCDSGQLSWDGCKLPRRISKGRSRKLPEVGGPRRPERAVGAGLAGTSFLRGRGRSRGVVFVRSCDNDIHPNTHGFRAGGHHIEKAFVGLDAEGQAGTGALEYARREGDWVNFHNCFPKWGLECLPPPFCETRFH